MSELLNSETFNKPFHLIEQNVSLGPTNNTLDVEEYNPYSNYSVFNGLQKMLTLYPDESIELKQKKTISELLKEF